MGGLALKHLGVGRLSAAEYYDASNHVKLTFERLFNQPVHIIESYRTKPDFGGCDMIIEAKNLPQDWRQTLSIHYMSKGHIVNGNVTSMEIDGFQYDFIRVENLEKALVYFAYNDLGNLMGRVANAMGFKYGPFGLRKDLMHNNHTYASVVVNAPMADIFEFLGFNWKRFQEGFDTLEDIFFFVERSAFFNKSLYLLENRNNKDRVRDAKRPTYMKFLEWLEGDQMSRWFSQLENCHQWDESSKTEFFQNACHQWPEFSEECAERLKENAAKEDLKSRWNGDIVKIWTGLEGKELGQLMSAVREDPAFVTASENSVDLEALTRRLYRRGLLWGFKLENPPKAPK